MSVCKRLFFMCCCSFLLTGCWDRIEVNDLAFVTATSFDKLDDNLFRTAVQVPLPGNMGGPGSSGGGGGSGGTAPFYVDSGVGRNIRESNDDLQERMSRRLYFSHRRVIIFGEEIARGGFIKSLDVILQQPESRLSAYILLTKGESIDILNATPHFEMFSAETIREMAKSGFAITVKDVFNDMEKPGKDAIVPVVEIIKTQNQNPEQQKDEVMFNNIGVLKDDHLVFFTNEQETLGAFWLLEDQPRRNYTFPIKDDTEINVSVDEKKVNLAYSISDGTPSFELTLNLDTKMMQNEANFDLDETKNYEFAKDTMEKQIKGEIHALLDHAKSEGIDVYGFGWHLYQHENRKWEENWADNWDEMLEEIDIKVNVNANIQRSNNPGITIKE